MTIPEDLQAELSTISDEDLRQRLTRAMGASVTASIRSVLEQLTAFRRLLLYFNTHPDWDNLLQIIAEAVQADAVQVVSLDGLDALSYHLLPPDQVLDHDFAQLLHDGLTIDDQFEDGTVRLGVLLAVSDDLLGILMVVRHNGAPFSDHDRIILDNFAEELAVSLHNFALYALIREQAERLASIVQRSEDLPASQ